MSIGKSKKHLLFISVFLAFFSMVSYTCGSGGSTGGSNSSTPDNDNGSGGTTRAFMMGTTPFFMTPTEFPNWRFENLDDKDLLSLHADDFLGVPWVEFRDGLPRPAAWENKWTTLANNASATDKTLYLAVSPLGGRKTLTPRVRADGSTESNWAPVDVNGCYPFATEADAEGYKTAYINYLTYLINLVQPKYLSPAVEINILFTQCPAQKAAWIAWYTDVHNAIKSAFPALTIFPTFQMEHMYGISDAQAACTGGVSFAACFDQRLTEALTIPGDRIAFSTYPILWKYLSDYGFSYPTNTYAEVKKATSRKIWISETGWMAVKMLQSYQHGTVGTCGPDFFPANFANDTEHANYLAWLLGEAQTHGFEVVIWWLNRDYLDSATAATCPCSGINDTCTLADLFYSAGGDTDERLLRMFGNMALRYYDGSPRPGHATWRDYFNRSLSPAN